MKTITAPVCKIIPFSNVDGPGNRTSVFFQGCSFRCLFCHNPETISLCRHCGSCVPACPAGALSMAGDGRVEWNRDACVQCDECIRACRFGASPRVRWMTVGEVMDQISRTAPYIGGVTVSGGECSLYNEFLLELFSEVRKMGKTCLMDTNGSFDFEADPRVLSVCDGVMLDVKAVDPQWSMRLVSRGPETVLKNLDYLLNAGKLHEARTVVFPGFDEKNRETVRYVSSRIRDRCMYRIIRYRPFGVREEYQALLGAEETEEDAAARYAALAKAWGASRAYYV